MDRPNGSSGIARLPCWRHTAGVDGEAYLRRLGLQAPPATDLDGLRRLQRAHLEAVPFENSSVLRGEPIVLEEPRLVRKIVDERRGGFCFELNGAFAWLLGALGFEVALLPGSLLGRQRPRAR